MKHIKTYEQFVGENQVNENWSDKLKKMYGDDYQGFQDIQWNKNTPAAKKTKKKYGNDGEVIASALKSFQANAERLRNESTETGNAEDVNEGKNKFRYDYEGWQQVYHAYNQTTHKTVDKDPMAFIDWLAKNTAPPQV